MTDKIQVQNVFGMVGTWAGFEFPGLPRSVQDTDLSVLLAEVKARHPDYAKHPPIVVQMRKCRELLLKGTLLNLRGIQDLLTFEGTAVAFRPILDQALQDYNLTAQISEKARHRAILTEQLENLRGLRINRLWELMKAGALGAPAVEAWTQCNKILDTYTTTLSKIMRNIGGVNDTLKVQSCAVGSNYDLPATSQTDLGHQIGSNKAPTDSTYTGYQTTFLTSYITSENNGTETTTATVTDSSHFTLTSATGFATGDRVIVTGTGLSADGEKSTITLSGVAVTLDSALSIPPPVGAKVRRIWGETGLRINGDSALGTRSRVSDGGYDKGNGTDVLKAIFVESAITLRIVGS